MKIKTVIWTIVIGVLFIGKLIYAGSIVETNNVTLTFALSVSNLVITSANGTYTNTITFNGTGLVSTITP